MSDKIHVTVTKNYSSNYSDETNSLTFEVMSFSDDILQKLLVLFNFVPKPIEPSKFYLSTIEDVFRFLDELLVKEPEMGKILAIKHVRNYFNLGLKDCKDLVELHPNYHNK